MPVYQLPQTTVIRTSRCTASAVCDPPRPAQPPLFGKVCWQTCRAQQVHDIGSLTRISTLDKTNSSKAIKYVQQTVTGSVRLKQHGAECSCSNTVPTVPTQTKPCFRPCHFARRRMQVPSPVSLRPAITWYLRSVSTRPGRERISSYDRPIEAAKSWMACSIVWQMCVWKNRGPVHATCLHAHACSGNHHVLVIDASTQALQLAASAACNCCRAASSAS